MGRRRALRRQRAGSGSRRRVTARGGRQGYASQRGHLGGKSLLEFYFIDVGQGDGILIKTPSFRHVMMDGGFPRSVQDNREERRGTSFDWKFVKDYGKTNIELDAMLASHCDADHYGGLRDLLDVAQKDELDATGVSVEALFHAGLFMVEEGWWRVFSVNRPPMVGKSSGRSCSVIAVTPSPLRGAGAVRSFMVGGMTSSKRL